MVDDSLDDTLERDATIDPPREPSATLRGPAGPDLAIKGVRASTDPGSAPTLQPAPGWRQVDTAPAAPRAKRLSADGTEVAPAAARYTLGPRIGEGGMGEVLVAFDEQIGREVAVKRILAPRPSTDELSRFLREARVQGRLEHPAVVPVHELGIDAEGRPYFVMKRLVGEPMSAVLKRVRAGEEPDVAGARRRMLRAFADVCLALELAHSRGVVHRDLKPANIMLGDFGEVYVLDWGVARVLANDDNDATATTTPSITTTRDDLALTSGETRAGAILGTPAYMAPEQLAGDPATAAADIYALGCVLFEIVANEALHTRGRAVVKVSDARPSARRPDAPPELDAICQRATELDPEARFPSARGLGDAVQAYLDGDRDVVVRRELAALHLSRAREALGRADGSLAMREAGRALALDPEGEAALLVTQLMLQPPSRTPPEVEARLAELDVAAARHQGRMATLSMVGYLGFLPFLAWTGVRDWAHVVAYALVAILCGVQVYFLARSNQIRAKGIYLNAAINALLIGIVSRIVGPFLIAPTLVMTTLVAYAVHPRLGRIHIIAMMLGAGLAIPWLLEVVGVLSSTYHFEAGRIILESPAIAFSSLPVQLAFVALLVALITIVALLSRTLAHRQRDVTRRIELQAWQLRQLVPAKS